jgi:hypothetical protein
MSSDKRVEFTQDGAVAMPTLDNPPLNLISEELMGDRGRHRACYAGS